MRKVPRYVIFSALKVYWKHEEEEEEHNDFARQNVMQTTWQSMTAFIDHIISACTLFQSNLSID